MNNIQIYRTLTSGPAFRELPRNTSLSNSEVWSFCDDDDKQVHLHAICLRKVHYLLSEISAMDAQDNLFYLLSVCLYVLTLWSFLFTWSHFIYIIFFLYPFFLMLNCACALSSLEVSLQTFCLQAITIQPLIRNWKSLQSKYRRL